MKLSWAWYFRSWGPHPHWEIQYIPAQTQPTIWFYSSISDESFCLTVYNLLHGHLSGKRCDLEWSLWTTSMNFFGFICRYMYLLFIEQTCSLYFVSFLGFRGGGFKHHVWFRWTGRKTSKQKKEHLTLNVPFGFFQLWSSRPRQNHQWTPWWGTGHQERTVHIPHGISVQTIKHILKTSHAVHTNIVYWGKGLFLYIIEKVWTQKYRTS